MKPGRLVVMLAGRYAGKKAILIKANEESTKVNHKMIVLGCKIPKWFGGWYLKISKKSYQENGLKVNQKANYIKSFH